MMMMNPPKCLYMKSDFILFNRNGCTPFVEVYVGEDRVMSTSQEYEKMRWVLTDECLISVCDYVKPALKSKLKRSLMLKQNIQGYKSKGLS